MTVEPERPAREPQPAAEPVQRTAGGLLGANLDLVMLGLLPFLLYAVNDTWTFMAPSGQIDPYIYTGYMRDLKEYVGTYGETYYGSRLPHIVVGALLHMALPATLASLVLRFVLFYASLFALYGIVRVLWHNRVAAAITAALFCCQAYFLGAIAWDYVDGPAIACILATLFFLAVAATSRYWQLALVAAGFFAVTVVTLNVFLLLVVPVFAAWFFMLNARSGRRRLTDVAYYTFEGAAAAYLLYAAINIHLGGGFDYLGPQRDAAQGLSRTPLDLSPSSFALAGWLAFIAAGALTAVALLVKLSQARRQSTVRLTDFEYRTAVACIVALGSIAIFVAAELTVASPFQFSYYADLLYPFVVLPMGAGVALALEGAGVRARWYLIPAAVLILLLPFATSLPDDLVPRPPASGSWSYGLPLLAASLALLILAAAKPRIATALGAIAMFSILNITMSQQGTILLSGQDLGKSRARLVLDVDDALARVDGDSRLKYWYDLRDPLGNVFRGVASMHLWEHDLLSENFPGLVPPDGRERKLAAPQRIAVLSSSEGAFESVTSVAASQGVRAKVVSEMQVRRGADVVRIVVIETEALPVP
jgi:hypothetical protein